MAKSQLHSNTQKKTSDPLTKNTYKENISLAIWYLSNSEYENARKVLMQLIFDREFEGNSNRVFYMLGVACFGVNDILSAQKYFENALEQNPQHVLSKLYLAVIYILTDNRLQALDQLMESQSIVKIINKGKNSKYIRNALNLIKNNTDNDDKLLEIFNHPYKNHILPRFGIAMRRKAIIRKLVLIFFIFGLIGGGGVFYAYKTNLVANLISLPEQKNERSKIITKIDQTLEAQVLQKLDNDKIFISLTKKEFEKILKTMESDFINYRDNQVWVAVNTILHSNVSQEQKNRVLLIAENLKGVDYASSVAWYDFKEVNLVPWKYNNVIVKWKGTIAKIEPTENGSTAQFLLNYYATSKELLATIPVHIPPNITLHNGSEIEILAKIKVAEPSATKKDFGLDIYSFRYLIN